MPVKWQDLQLAFEFASLGQFGEHQAYLCRESGEFLWHSEFGDEIDELPDDIDDEEKYLSIPDKRELDLGKSLVFDFVRCFLPGELDNIRRMFSKGRLCPVQ